MMYLGLDLGTGLAKLARCPAGTRSPATGVADITVVPTAVIYRGLASEIPVRGAAEMPPGVVRCDGFPMMLDAALSASRVAAWRSRTPGEVTQGFLRCLLDALERRLPDRTGPARNRPNWWSLSRLPGVTSAAQAMAGTWEPKSATSSPRLGTHPAG